MEREIQAQEEHKRAAMAKLSNPRGTRSSIRRAGQHGPNHESAQTSTEYRLGYNLGQTDRQTAQLHRTAHELLAAFEGNFGVETLASSDAFESGYNAGYGLAGPGAGERDAGGQRGRNPDLYDKIQDHLKSGGVVVIRTHLKQWEFKPKHAAMFRRGKAGESGVYMQRGKSWDYVLPEYVHFGRYTGRTNPCTTPPRGHRGLSQKNPDEPSGDGSPEYEQARRTAELFHGRPVKEQIEVTEQIKTHDWYVAIGPLINLKVKPLSKEPRKMVSLPFPKKGEEIVHLFCSPDGRQFYLRGGDQELNLEALGMGEGTEWFRDHMLIGEAKEITYRDAKKFHRFDLVDYYHQLGEVTKKRPMLAYDSLAHKLSIVGGQYKVEMEDLVDGMSPGIVN